MSVECPNQWTRDHRRKHFGKALCRVECGGEPTFVVEIVVQRGESHDRPWNGEARRQREPHAEDGEEGQCARLNPRCETKHKAEEKEGERPRHLCAPRPAHVRYRRGVQHTHKRHGRKCKATSPHTMFILEALGRTEGGRRRTAVDSRAKPVGEINEGGKPREVGEELDMIGTEEARGEISHFLPCLLEAWPRSGRQACSILLTRDDQRDEGCDGDKQGSNAVECLNLRRKERERLVKAEGAKKVAKRLSATILKAEESIGD
mmetsp:Transcript_15782/g.34281  ORF Transcript_15782/g.34281 Transcript_15782/m.34281 type:complete len:262 (+) Transcript_15782:154-939(+)